MAFALYRKSSNEVLKGHSAQSFADADSTYFGVAVDPSTPDGTDVRDRSGPDPGPFRQLGFAKIYLPGTNTIRNATQQEIDTFAGFEQADRNAQDAELAQGMVDETHRFSNPTIRKILKAFIKLMILENNTQATAYNALRAEMLAAGSLADLKVRITENTSALPIRTQGQAKTALLNELRPDD